jgi:hypothetical protein
MPRGVPARSVARITFNALLQAAKAIDEAQHLGHHSIVFVAPDIGLTGCVGGRTESSRNRTGLSNLANARQVTVIRGA